MRPRTGLHPSRRGEDAAPQDEGLQINVIPGLRLSAHPEMTQKDEVQGRRV
jgi:hypothetical protein